jgi:hypothetical protein
MAGWLEAWADFLAVLLDAGIVPLRWIVLSEGTQSAQVFDSEETSGRSLAW